MVKYIWILVFLNLACVSFTDEKKVAPKITDKMPLVDVLSNGIEFGGRTLSDAVKQVKKKKEWVKAEEHLYKLLISSADSDDLLATSLINTMELFRASRSKRANLVFKKYVRQNGILKRQLAWQLASDIPSEEMGRAIEEYLTEALTENEIDQAYVPAMADAVASNRLTDSYTVVREGLFHSNDIAFARAMISLDSQRASIDFLDYLAKAPVEELRQMTLKSVDVYTCTLILEHFRSAPPAATHPGIRTLFYFAISRNNAFAEMARDILEKYLPHNSESFALTLSRLPSWMQIAFIERSARRLTPMISLFLGDLKKVTVDKDVVDEITELKL